MKILSRFTAFISLIVAVSLFAGCATTVQQITPYAGDTAFTVVSAVLLASKNASQDAHIINGIALKIQSLTTGTVITPDQFRAALLSVVPQNDQRYITLVNGLTRIYTRAQTYIKTDYSAYLTFLNDLSTGVVDATAGY